MSTETRNKLVKSESSAMEGSATMVSVFAFLVFLLSWATVFQWIGIRDAIAGVAVVDWYAAGLFLMGGTVLAFGLVSRAGLVDTSPSDEAGAVPGIVFGSVGIGVGFFVVADWIGLGPVVGLLGGLIVGAVAFAATVLPREDLGSTLVPGAFLVFLGGLIVADVLTVTWTFSPTWWSVTFAGDWTIPVMTSIVSLIAVWSAGKARGGFGTSGRQAGAFALIAMNAFAMLSMLGLVIAFVVFKGHPMLLAGFDGILAGTLSIPWVGVTLPWPDLPFVGNPTSSLFVDVPGVMPAIMGTIWLVVGAVLFAVPLGVGAAVFLTEYAERGRFTAIIEIATNGLWSTPSIVFGLFGFAFLVPRFADGSQNILSGQLVLGFMLLPLVLITSREAILAVPKAHRDASAALGVSRWETIRSVVLPSAAPGIVTGVILGVGRIAGETAPILLTIRGPNFPRAIPGVIESFRFTSTPPFVANDALLQPASALPLQLFATIQAGASPRPEEYTQAEFGWGVALVLLLVVLGFYAIGIASRIYFRRQITQ
jgi:phosphate transport system permease protein